MNGAVIRLETSRNPATPLRSRLGLGCAKLGSTLGGCHGAAALRLLQHALDRGVTLFDTADIYGQGESERLLGQALRGQRQRAVLVTKAGQRFTRWQRAAALLKPTLRPLSRALPGLRRGIAAQRGTALPRDYSAAYLRRAIEGSLRRLDTARIDLFLLHSPSAAQIQQGEAFAMLEDLRDAGTLGGWGISCDDLAAARAALQLPGLGGLQLPLALAASLQPELARFSTGGGRLLLREVLAGTATSADARQAAITSALDWPGATALIGTTSARHLDEALHVAAEGRAA